MMPKPSYQQLEIWWVNLDPTQGVETRKTRPCVVLPKNVINQHGLITIVAPLLKGHKGHPYVVNVSKTTQNNLDQDRRIDLLQMRAVDASRLLNKHGELEGPYFPAIQRAIRVIFGF